MLSQYPRIRAFLYKVQYVTAGVMLMTGVGFAAAQHELPGWYGVTAAVLTAFWTYTGVQADSNTPVETNHPALPEE